MILLSHVHVSFQRTAQVASLQVAKSCVSLHTLPYQGRVKVQLYGCQDCLRSQLEATLEHTYIHTILIQTHIAHLATT